MKLSDGKGTFLVTLKDRKEEDKSWRQCEETMQQKATSQGTGGKGGGGAQPNHKYLTTVSVCQILKATHSECVDPRADDSHGRSYSRDASAVPEDDEPSTGFLF